LDQSSNTSVESTAPQTEGQPAAPSHEGYDQWQARRLMVGLALCLAFVIAAIIYEKCG
jgi:hypothetical protein